MPESLAETAFQFGTNALFLAIVLWMFRSMWRASVGARLAPDHWLENRLKRIEDAEVRALIQAWILARTGEEAKPLTREDFRLFYSEARAQISNARAAARQHALVANRA